MANVPQWAHTLVGCSGSVLPKMNGRSCDSKKAPPIRAARSVSEWMSNFQTVIAASSGARRVLDEWAFFGLSEAFVLTALWIYCLPPTAETSVSVISSVIDFKSLARTLRDVSGELESAYKLCAAQLFPLLDEIDRLTAPVHGRKLVGCASELAAYQPQILRLCSVVFDGWSTTLRRSAASRKLVATRALVWLYLAAHLGFGQKKSRIYDDLGLLLDAANDASGKREKFAGADQIRLRIKRFRDDHPDEFAWMQRHLKSSSVPNPADLFVLLTFGPLLC